MYSRLFLDRALELLAQTPREIKRQDAGLRFACERFLVDIYAVLKAAGRELVESKSETVTWALRA
jgi:hypothetical protein